MGGFQPPCAVAAQVASALIDGYALTACKLAFNRGKEAAIQTADKKRPLKAISMRHLASIRTDGVALLVAVIILALSLLPNTTGAGGNQYDLIFHILAYAVLTCAASINRQTISGYLAVLCAITLFGGTIELIQPFVGRAGDLRDLVANVAGCFAGLMMTMTIKAALKLFRIDH